MPSARSKSAKSKTGLGPTPADEFADHVRELLEPLGQIGMRRMFGGRCLYCDGTVFALIADDVLYLKVDGHNRPAFEARGLTPFKPFDDKPMVMSYYPVPEEALEDSGDLCAWARPALEAGLRAAAVKRR